MPVVVPAFVRSHAWRLAAVLVVVLVHLVAHRPATTPHHDDLVTLQLAAGSLPTWSEIVRGPEWHTADDYHQLVERDAPASLTTVVDQVSRLDIHPPTHELLVSWWIPIADRAMSVLLLLNVAMAGALAWVLHALARRLGASRPLATMAAIAGAASPGMVITGLELRPYMLAALIGTTLVAWSIAVVDEGDASDRLGGARWWQGVVLVSLLALTSYAGVFVALGVATVVAARGGTVRRRLKTLGAMVVGGGVALASWPHALDQLSRQAEMQSNPVFHALATRGRRVVEALASPVWPEPAVWLGVLVLAGMLVSSVMACRRRGRLTIALATVVAVATTGHVTFYVLGRAESWAMAPKYVAFVLPLAALLVVAAFPDRRDTVAALGLALVGLSTLSWSTVVAALEPPPPEAVAAVDAVLVTNPRRGVGLRPLWHVPGATAATVGARHALLPLVELTPGCTALIVHNSQGGGSNLTPEQFNDAFRAHGWRLEQVAPPALRSQAFLARRSPCRTEDA